MAIRDHSMLPFQCSAPPSVKVAKMRGDGVSFARAATGELWAITPQWLEMANRDVNFDALGISPGESVEIANRFPNVSPPFARNVEERRLPVAFVCENLNFVFFNDIGRT
ncbi:hypothetical protein K0M31_020318 [Melipona bicolor]|uniref:Uncharacterized protein n=1 Tax=Melipona bicolor TaxID=60889 RepID=A0AA40G1E7_9HYME|nr:hypothetical protein K0M31_020318 [Melipona bicolor]